jgi:protein-tyrosine phosphatase
MRKPRRKRRLMIIAALALLAAAVVGPMLWSLRWEVWPKRFAEVEPGWLYRGGQVDARLIEGLVDEHQFEAVLSLTRLSPDDPDEAAELALIERRQLDLCVIPMPGDGRGSFEQLDRAADFIAAHQGRPIFVHCAGGEKRSGAAIVAYRLKHCGWTIEQALAEAMRYGLSVRHAELIEHLTAYAKALHKPTSQPAGAVTRPA